MEATETDPSKFMPNSTSSSSEPQALTLHWTLGINKDVVGGVHNLSDAESSDMFYAAAHTGVIFDYNTGVQRLLQGHVNPISATAVSKDKKWIVTADTGPDSMMVVWERESGTPVKTFFNPHPCAQGDMYVRAKCRLNRIEFACADRYGVHALDIAPKLQYLVTLSASVPYSASCLWFLHGLKDGVIARPIPSSDPMASTAGQAMVLCILRAASALGAGGRTGTMTGKGQRKNLDEFKRREQQLAEAYHKNKPLCFNACSYQKTHPVKAQKGHKDADACLTVPLVLGVADGVSQIEDFGIDASMLPNELLQEAGASKRGVDEYLGEANAWHFRRCFKTHAFPHLFPCRYPFPKSAADSVPPKVLVLVADPRHAFAVWWQTLGQLEPDVSLDLDFGNFLKIVAQQGWCLFGNYIEHAAAWAREEELYPDNVRLCMADRLGSLDPQDVRTEMRDIADFLMIPPERADRVVDSIFRRPADACSSLSRDRLVDYAVLQGGHIVENTGRNLYQFQDAYDTVDGLVQDMWRQMFLMLGRTGSSCLVEAAQKALQGSASLPPIVKTGVFRGEDAHNGGTCRPCVFHLRGICRDTAETCFYCHMDGHQRTASDFRVDLQANPPRVDLNVLNILAEVLIEMREFEKCARLLKELLHLTPAQRAQSSGASISTDLVLHPSSPKVLLKKLHNCPVDIVAMLAVAMCQIPNENISEDPLYNSALEVVLTHPPETHSDLHLLLVDAMLADEATTADTVSRRWLRRANVRRWFAEQAHRILTLLEDCPSLEVDLRERQAMCRWRLGQVEEAALQLEALLEDPGERTEAELRNMRVRAAEAWIEIGNSSRADQVLSCLSYEDLQRSNALPPPLSTAERKSLYKELSETIDRTLSAAAVAKDMEHAHEHVGTKEELLRFFAKFRHLVYDCELDFKRLVARSTSAKEGSAPAIEDVKCNTSKPNAEDEASGLLRPDSSSDALALGMQSSGVSFESCGKLGGQWEKQVFGFEAYLTMVKHGVVIIRAFARSTKESKSREGTVQAAQAVEVCEMILSNRKLVAQRNPVKRRMMRDLAMLSLSVGFEARLWRVVFKHLRNICDRSGSDHVVALCSRLLFTHADVDGMGPGANKDRGDAAPWEHEKAHNASWGHRNTYAAAFTDVRGWALRKLLRRPRAFGLTLLCAHFCIIASQYPFAVAEYSRAHRLAPFEPLPALCTATAYLSFSMSRAAVCRHAPSRFRHNIAGTKATIHDTFLLSSHGHPCRSSSLS
ncbi:CFAP251 [Symbiodinium sp. CCMP2456]|nr:CFAP251 [Symbiodinium sp. CCMP2456]